MHTDDQYTAIKEIHGLLADSRKEFEAGSKRVPDDRVRELLHGISEDRHAWEAELEADLRQRKPKSDPGGGTIGGTLHRVLLGARDAVNSTSEVNVLAECERDESDLLGRYNSVLDSADLHETTRATMARQQAEVEKNLDRIIQLRVQLESVIH